jgi:hypothetical protein
MTVWYRMSYDCRDGRKEIIECNGEDVDEGNLRLAGMRADFQLALPSQ